MSEKEYTLLEELSLSGCNSDCCELSGDEYEIAEQLSERGLVETRYKERSWWARITQRGEEELKTRTSP